jgi:hypothetical protein
MPIFKVAFTTDDLTHLSQSTHTSTHTYSFHRVQLSDTTQTIDLFHDLYEYIRNLYKIQIGKNDEYEFVLRYIDEEGDVCAITSTSELLEALRQVQTKIIKIYVTSIKVDDSFTPELSESFDSIKSDTSSKDHDMVDIHHPPQSQTNTKVNEIELEDFSAHVKEHKEEQLSGDDNDYIHLHQHDVNQPSPVNSSFSVVSADLEQQKQHTEVDEKDNVVDESSLVEVELKDLSIQTVKPSSVHVEDDHELDFDAVPDPFEITKQKMRQSPNISESSPPSTPEISISSSSNCAGVPGPVSSLSTPNLIPTEKKDDSQNGTHSSNIRCFSSGRDFYCRRCFSKIENVLYRCVHCHHFNLCQSCESKSDHPVNHAFIKVRDINRSNLRSAKFNARAYLRSYHPEYSLFHSHFYASYPVSELNASVINSDNLDNFTVKVGESITKTWELVNSGKQAWPPGTQLRLSGGTIALASDSDHEQPSIELPCLQPGEKLNLSTLILLKNEPGTYHGSFGVYTSEGVCFGQACSIVINVEAVQSAVETSSKAEEDVLISKAVAPTAVVSEAPAVAPSLPTSKPVVSTSTKIKPSFESSSSPSTQVFPRVYPVVSSSPSNLSTDSNQVTAVPPQPLSEPHMYQNELRQLISMGFDVDTCRYMIILHKGDVNAAVNAILRQ